QLGRAVGRRVLLLRLARVVGAGRAGALAVAVDGRGDEVVGGGTGAGEDRLGDGLPVDGPRDGLADPDVLVVVVVLQREADVADAGVRLVLVTVAQGRLRAGDRRGRQRVVDVHVVRLQV